MSRSTRVLCYSLLFALTIAVLVNVSRAARAAGNPLATITVRSSADAGGTCPGVTCTLRQAIATAGSGDTIDFDLTTVTSPITLVSELAINKNLTITGPGASQLTISGNNTVRVFNIGSVTPAINVTISGLTMANGRHRGADGNPGGNGFGGGILNNSTGTLTINNSMISGNSAIGGDGTGGIASNLSAGGQGQGGGIYNASNGTLNISNSRIASNLAKGGGQVGGSSGPGGGAGGGGIFNNTGTVNLTNSTLNGNSAGNGNGQLLSGGGGGATIFLVGANGGGIANGSGVLNLTNSTLSGNSVDLGMFLNNNTGITAFFFGGSGGSVANNTGTVRITNSTLSGNSVNGGIFTGTGVIVGSNSLGGGISNGGPLFLTNSTIAGNSVVGVGGINGGGNGTGNGGGIENVSPATATAKNTIIATNTADVGPDFDGALTSQGWNLIGNNKDATITPAPGTADQIGTNAAPINPLLSPLTDNGGPTQTMALLAGSPAIDKGAAATDPITSTTITTDQRGFTRPVDDPAIMNATGGNGSDIGSFEAQAAGCSTIVTNLNDNGAGSLRAAVICSNLTAGTQTITFAPGVTGTITLTSGEMLIFDSVNIVGPGASVVTVSGNNSSRIFNIAAGNYNVTISGLTIANGRHRGTDGASPTNGIGGGILNNSTGTLAISNSVISGNTAIGGSSLSTTATGAQGIGGGIHNANGGTLNVTGCIFSGNVAKGGNGNTGPGQDSSHLGGSGSGGAIANNSGTINLINTTLAGNTVSNGDTITPGGMGTGGSTIEIGSSGGALSNVSGIVNITNTTVSGNFASGGLVSVNYNSIIFASGGLGGGVSNSTGTVRVTNSTFFGNSANGNTIGGTNGATNVIPLFSLGGGISNGGTLILTNSTFAGNTAVGTPSFNGGPSSTGNGGGIHNDATVNAKNTLIATNTANVGPDFDGTLTSQGWNLIGNNKDATITPAPGTADQIGTNAAPINPLLGPLANNGGPTMTMALLAGSPAIDKGAAATDPISGTPITTDQRGFARPSDDPAIANATGGNGSDIGAFEAQVQAGPPTVAKAFSPATITVGGTSLLTITLSNAGSTVTGASLTDTLPAGLATVGGTAATTCGGTATQTANSVSLSGGTIPAGGSCTLSVQVTSTTVNSYTNTIPAGALTTTNGGANTASASAALTVVAVPVGSPIGPGLAYPATSELSDQKAGSVLIYNLYTSGLANPNERNTRISLTNSNPNERARVHLFFVDGTSCSVADSYLCLTQNQTTSFMASDLDPGTTGYIVAVAVDENGCPANFNFLIGDEYVKFASGHRANLAAEAIAALPGLPVCGNTTVTATLSFDGLSYNALPRVLAVDNVPSRADGNDTMLILNRIGGNLGVGAATLINLFGILYNDQEVALSFGFGGSSSSPGTCQFRSSLSNTFPRVTPRFEQFIPAGRSGWLKVYSQTDIALLGATINVNDNAATSAGAFNQGHNLHKLTLTTAANYVIPVFPPGC